YVAQQADPYVTAPLVQKHRLREGMLLAGPVEGARKGSGPKLVGVEQIESDRPEAYQRRNFDELTPIDPHEQIHLETGKEPLTTRVMDLLTPIGKGQRGLIVAPPRTGKTGRTMSGGIDVRALEIPKRLFGTARAFEEGGSLTVMGTALIETGSRMDDIIFQEFKGTGNMELVLDRKLADRRIFPALDITQSGTRKEERILTPDVLQRVTLLRRGLVKLNPIPAMEGLVKKMSEYPSNAAFLEKIGAFLA